MKYGEMFRKCLDTIRHAVVEDYRPNEKMYVDDLEDKLGIRLWFDNGDSAIYFPGIKEGEPPGNLISRQETIKAIEEHANFILNSYPYEQVTKDIYEAAHRHIIEVIKTLPAARADTSEYPDKL